MTTDGDNSTPDAPHGAGSEALQPRGAATYLEQALAVLRPDSAEERARDRKALAGLTASFLKHHYVASYASPLRADVRDELLSLAQQADDFVARLVKLSEPARLELGLVYKRDTTCRRLAWPSGDERALFRYGPLSRLQDELSALAVFAEKASEKVRRLKGKGGALNYHTAPFGTPLRYLAFEAALYINLYRAGAIGLRPRRHLRITGYPDGPVHKLTRNIAAYALGEEPSKGFDDVVERAVADWKKRKRDELSCELSRQLNGPGDSWPSSGDQDMQIAVLEADARIAARRRRR